MRDKTPKYFEIENLKKRRTFLFFLFFLISGISRNLSRILPKISSPSQSRLKNDLIHLQPFRYDSNKKVRNKTVYVTFVVEIQ